MRGKSSIFSEHFFNVCSPIVRAAQFLNLNFSSSNCSKFAVEYNAIEMVRFIEYVREKRHGFFGEVIEIS